MACLTVLLHSMETFAFFFPMVVTLAGGWDSEKRIQKEASIVLCTEHLGKKIPLCQWQSCAYRE